MKGRTLFAKMICVEILSFDFKNLLNHYKLVYILILHSLYRNLNETFLLFQIISISRMYTISSLSMVEAKEIFTIRRNKIERN